MQRRPVGFRLGIATVKVVLRKLAQAQLPKTQAGLAVELLILLLLPRLFPFLGSLLHHLAENRGRDVVGALLFFAYAVWEGKKEETESTRNYEYNETLI